MASVSISLDPWIKRYVQRLLECQKIVVPVMANMFLTLVCWMGIYQMKVDEQLAELLFGNLGQSPWDALINGFYSSLMLVCVAFVMLAFAMYDLRRLVEFWLYSSCVLLLFIVSSHNFYALLLGPDKKNATVQELFPVIVCTTVYGLGGLVTYFTSHLPAILHRVYVVTNCSLVSLYYLRCFPGYTAWVVLVAVACWDIFAVLSPYGPLNLVQTKAKDYSADVLRFLMFSASDDPPAQMNVVKESDMSEKSEESEECEESIEGSEEEETSSSSSIEVIEAPEQLTAEDALNDDNFKLGMGDFVFYGLLVGKSAASGSLMATAGCVSGIIYGLILTLVFFSSEDRTTPALPLSIFLGILFHVGSMQLESLIHNSVHFFSDLYLFSS